MRCGAFVPIGNADVHPCDSPKGGDKTVKPPGYSLVVKNPPATQASCLMQDDNEVLIQEDDGDFICLDNV